MTDIKKKKKIRTWSKNKHVCIDGGTGDRTPDLPQARCDATKHSQNFSTHEGRVNGWLTADILPLNHSPTFLVLTYNVEYIILIFDDPVA